MRIRRVLGLLALTGTTGAALASLPAPAADAVTTGDASALVYVAPTGSPGLPATWAFNSTGAGLAAGRTGLGRFYLDVLGNNGRLGTAQLSMWHRDDAANDPICSIHSAVVLRTKTRISVRCFDNAGGPIDAGQFFLTYTNRSRPDKVGAGGPGLVRLTTTSSTAKEQRPSRQYRSSGSGTIVVYRQNPGIYQVRVPGGALAPLDGVAFVSAVGGTARWCNPQAWYPVGTAMYVDVRCYGPTGALADSRFSLTLTRTNIFGQPAYPGGSQFAPWTPTSFVATTYGWNSASMSNTVSSGASAGDDPAETVVRFDGTGAAPTTSIMVSGYGPLRCNVHRDASGTGGPSPYLYVVVRCIDAAGAVVSQSASASKILAA